MIALRRSLSAQSVFTIDGEPAHEWFRAEALEKWQDLGAHAAEVVVAVVGLISSAVLIAVALVVWA